jgi:hypothetical protein
MMRMRAMVAVTRGGMRRPEVNFVADENHRHVDAEGAEIREPIGGDSGEGVGIVDCIDDTEDMGLADFRVKMLTVIWFSCIIKLV